MDAPFITTTELRQLADLCEILNDFDGTELSVGEVPVADINGEILGYLRPTNTSGWALFKEGGDESV